MFFNKKILLKSLTASLVLTAITPTFADCPDIDQMDETKELAIRYSNQIRLGYFTAIQSIPFPNGNELKALKRLESYQDETSDYVALVHRHLQSPKMTENALREMNRNFYTSRDEFEKIKDAEEVSRSLGRAEKTLLSLRDLYFGGYSVADVRFFTTKLERASTLLVQKVAAELKPNELDPNRTQAGEVSVLIQKNADYLGELLERDGSFESQKVIVEKLNRFVKAVRQNITKGSFSKKVKDAVARVNDYRFQVAMNFAVQNPNPWDDYSSISRMASQLSDASRTAVRDAEKTRLVDPILKERAILALQDLADAARRLEFRLTQAHQRIGQSASNFRACQILYMEATDRVEDADFASPELSRDIDAIEKLLKELGRVYGDIF